MMVCEYCQDSLIDLPEHPAKIAAIRLSEIDEELWMG